MSFRFTQPSARRRPSLTPMIDVVFLLLVFFMLVARFGQEGVISMQIGGTGEAGEWSGPPRLVEIGVDGLQLNGVALAETDLANRLRGLMSDEADLTLLQAGEGVSLQRLIDVMEGLEAGGITNLALIGR